MRAEAVIDDAHMYFDNGPVADLCRRQQDARIRHKADGQAFVMMGNSRPKAEFRQLGFIAITQSLNRLAESEKCSLICPIYLLTTQQKSDWGRAEHLSSPSNPSYQQ
jgi:hypothetical protein